MSLRTIGTIAVCLCGFCGSAKAWTIPAPVVATSQDSLDPRLSVDASGKAYVVWRERFNGSGLFYIEYTDNTAGSFTAPVTISQGGSVGSGSPVVCANGSDVHTAWIASPGDNYEIWYRKRTAGTWGSTYNASNTSIKSLRPAIAARGNVGPVVAWDEAVYADDNYDTFFSEWTGSGFSSAINIANTVGGAVYGSTNVTTVVAPNGDVTAAWADRITGDYHVNVRRRVSGVWQARQEISTLAVGPSTPGLVAGADSRVHVVYESSNSVYYQSWNGSSWAAPVQLPGGLSGLVRPKIAVDENGFGYVVADAFTDGNNNRDVFFSANATGTWSNWSDVSNTLATQSINGDVGYGNNSLTIAWQENSDGAGGTGVFNTWYVVGPKPSTGPTGTLAGTVYDGFGVPLSGALVTIGGVYQTASGANGTYSISGVAVGTYSATATKAYYTTQTVNNIVIAAGNTTAVNFTISTAPPDPVSNFVASGGNTANTLTWTNPGNGNFAGTVIRAKTSGYPTGPSDGTLVADRSTAPGSPDTVVHAGLLNGTTYYYAAFAYAGTGGRAYAVGVTATATASGPADLDRDGDVDQTDWGLFQACLTGAFNPQNDPACTAARLDADNDVDGDDVNLFIGCISEPSVYANPNCLP